MFRGQVGFVPGCQEADALVFLQVQVGQGCRQDGGDDPNFARGQTNLEGICLGHQKRLRKFWRRLGLAPQVMHGKTKPDQLEAPLLYTRVSLKEVPVMRYHSLTIEDMPEDFVITSRTTDDQKRLWGFNIVAYRFCFQSPSRKYRNARWAQRPSKILSNLVSERKMKQVTF